jgi:hypothetical protein
MPDNLWAEPVVADESYLLTRDQLETPRDHWKAEKSPGVAAALAGSFAIAVQVLGGVHSNHDRLRWLPRANCCRGRSPPFRKIR